MARALEDRATLDRILSLLTTRTGVDVSGYRRPTVERRVRNRMLMVGVPSLAAYLDRLASVEDEATRLLERVTIKVSRFYRNAATFDALRAAVPGLLARTGGFVRVWSAGCAAGEEAYTLAMLLDEAGAPAGAGVIATDVDRFALAAARRGAYAAEALAELPTDLRARYLQPDDDGARPAYVVSARLRDRVRLERHDLIGASAPPGGARFELVCCRNVLIYLQPHAQQRVYELLDRAVAPGGYLCLGEAEWPPPAFVASFELVDRRMRLFRRAVAARSAPRAA